MNMAIDHVLLDQCPTHAQPLLRIYAWEGLAISFGRSQTYPSQFAATHALVRRPTGGGLVWHDADVTYTVVLPIGHPLAQMEIHESYHVIHAALAEQLGDHAHLQETPRERVDLRTLRCFRSPVRHDILSTDGSKLAGAAQLRTPEGVLMQGSIALAATHGDRVALTNAIRAAFRRFAEAPEVPWQPESAFWEAVNHRIHERYGQPLWNETGTESPVATNETTNEQT